MEIQKSKADKPTDVFMYYLLYGCKRLKRGT